MAMVELLRESGMPVVRGRGYRLALLPDRPFARLSDDAGAWADLALFASLHTSQGLDDTAALADPRVEQHDDRIVICVEATSSRWDSRRTLVACHEDRIETWTEITGSGDLTDAHLLGGFCSAIRRWGSGFLASGHAFASLMSPEPSDPTRAVQPAGEPAALDVVGNSLPGRGHWFFTPPPFCLALSRDQPPAPAMEPAERLPLPAGPWLGIGLVADAGAHTFTGMHYEPVERAFNLRLAYEGATAVDGSFATPRVALFPGQSDPYATLAAHAALLREGGRTHAPPAGPAWWRRPIFCGWGAQCHLAGPAGHAPSLSRQEHYDRWLDGLEARGIRPGTIVIDDKWQLAYGTNEADPDRWPDLRAWIAARHARDQRVLLWWKAWDPEGLAPERCVRNAAGGAVAADPTEPGYRSILGRSVERMLGPAGYDADGLKIDFTANTPSGPGMTRHGAAWGVELLRELLATVHEAAVGVKPDALLITHAPNPYLAPYAGMLRLNDVMRLDDPQPGAPYVAHMRHRAAIVRAACPDSLIDTDQWAMPDLATWRRYAAIQPQLGVPSLYYATHIDRSGEALTAADDALIRAWD
jgi:hypothetical protein